MAAELTNYLDSLELTSASKTVAALKDCGVATLDDLARLDDAERAEVCVCDAGVVCVVASLSPASFVEYFVSRFESKPCRTPPVLHHVV
jgi:hypothetical protein